MTGAASGIGRASAELLASQGARVIVADIDDGAGKAVARSIGNGARFVHLDVSDERSWQRLVSGVGEDPGWLDGLVNAAGVDAAGDDVEHCTPVDWGRVLAINLEGTYLGCMYGLRALESRKVESGSIVNLCSVLGVVGSGETLAYSASKGGVRMLTRTVAQHAQRSGLGVRCNAIHPGYIATPMTAATIEYLSASSGRGPAEVEASLAALHPMGRLGMPEEIAHAVAYLLSDDSAYMTGAELPVDGGYLAV